ncbi:MAG: phosphatidylglycerophosphatase A [Alphaproteobacteria bacterium]|nr:phosphatidylglycerophosphatase A [Alphaproteobacteria bacterium]
MKNKIAYILATYLGLGYSPKAPGTAGSLGTIPLAALLAYFFGTEGILAAAIVVFFIGVWATNEIIKNQENKDPSIVVIDEVAGQLLTFTFVASSLVHNFDKWYLYLIGFGLFRLFDIVKLGPVKWADTKLKNAWGVMLDDVFAGIIASIFLLLINIYMQ